MSAAARIILCADDFALTEGVSRGIVELAMAERLSAASALVTTRHWPAAALQLRALREKIAIGLHINLTLGRPLGDMPKLCPSREFPSLGSLLRRALLSRIPVTECTTEIARQLTAFEEATGSAPDFIDGHQHVHALPTVRTAFLDAIVRKAWSQRPLIRDPFDRSRTIIARGVAVGKSLAIAALSRGFGSAVQAAGLPTNDSFSGASTFDPARPYQTELAHSFSHPGSLHLVMCHPGHVDAELPALDAVSERRAQELEALMTYPDLPARLWHPERLPSGAIDWGSRAVAHG